MRKEVYKRKPKKSFVRIKKHQKLSSNIENAPEFNASKEYQHYRFKALYERRWFRIFAFTIFLLVAGFIVWLTLYLPYEFKDGKAAFESEGITTYYTENSFDKLGNFLNERRDKLDGIVDPFYQVGLVIWLRSTDYEEDALFGRTHYEVEENEKMRINNGVLIISSDNGERAYDSDWRINLEINNIAEIDPSVFDYLKTDKLELDAVLRQVANQSLKLTNSDTSSVISFDHYYGYYSIHFTTKVDSTKSLIKEILPDVYLVNRY